MDEQENRDRSEGDPPMIAVHILSPHDSRLIVECEKRVVEALNIFELKARRLIRHVLTAGAVGTFANLVISQRPDVVQIAMNGIAAFTALLIADILHHHTQGDVQERKENIIRSLRFFSGRLTSEEAREYLMANLEQHAPLWLKEAVIPASLESPESKDPDSK